MTESERDALIERLVKATGDEGYRTGARSFSEEYLRRYVESSEAAAREVRRFGHLGATSRESARAAEILARRG